MPGFSSTEVAQYYDAWTQRYEDAFGDVFQACRPVDTDELIDYVIQEAGLTSGMRVLDAGCGVCGPSIRLARALDLRIDAVTISAVQAELARQRVHAAGLGGQITVHQADFAELADVFPADCFDRALFLESMSHAAQLGPVLRGVRTVLTDNGRVYIKDFFQRQYDQPEEARWCQEVTRRVEQEFRVRVRPVTQLHQELALADLTVVDSRPLDFAPSLREWTDFATRNGIDLYRDGAPIEWSTWLGILARPSPAS